MQITAAIPSRSAETRTLLSISIPLVAAYLAEMGMMITDMIMVGHLGSKELAAVGLTADWVYVLLLIGMGVVSIVGVLAAQNLGARNLRGVIDAVEQGMVAATLMSVPVMLCIWYLGPALRHANQDPEVVSLIIDYSRPLAACVLPALWFVVLRNLVTAMARASVIMLITALALALNLALNYTLVFGKFGFPALGVVGAACGTVIVNWLMFATLAVHVKTAPQFRHCRPSLVPRRIVPATLREIFVLGLPITGAQILGGAMFTVAAVIVGMLSADALAAQQIVYTVIYVALSAAVAIGDAVRVRVAWGIGMGSVAAARQSANIAFFVAAVVTVLAAAVLWIFPQAIVGLFLNTAAAANAGVVLIAVTLSAYAAMFQLVDGLLIVIANALRGLRDTQAPMWIAMAGYWFIGIGVGAWLCISQSRGAEGLWVGLILGALVAIALMSLRYQQRMRHAERHVAVPALRSA